MHHYRKRRKTSFRSNKRGRRIVNGRNESKISKISYLQLVVFSLCHTRRETKSRQRFLSFFPILDLVALVSFMKKNEDFIIIVNL